MYTIIDVLNKLIVLEKKGYEMYKKISLMEDIDENIKVVARILASEEKKHTTTYEKIKKQVLEAEGDIPSIDFDVYDQASNLISSYIYPISGHVKDRNQLLKFALDFEKQTVSLIMSIQGLLIKKSEDSATITYDVLSQILKEEKKHIENIERFLR